MSDIKTIKYTDIFLGPVEMKTDTPISDSAYRNQDATMYSLCEEMKRMERILNLVSKERDDALMMLGVYRMKSDEQQQRIKRLEEAGDAMEVYCDAIAAHNWNKAKEAKP